MESMQDLVTSTKAMFTATDLLQRTSNRNYNLEQLLVHHIDADEIRFDLWCNIFISTMISRSVLNRSAVI